MPKKKIIDLAALQDEVQLDGRVSLIVGLRLVVRISLRSLCSVYRNLVLEDAMPVVFYTCVPYWLDRSRFSLASCQN